MISIAFDFSATDFNLTFSNFLANPVIFTERTFVFSDLDFSPESIITGVTFTGGTGSFDSVSFTDNSITLNTPVQPSIGNGDSVTLNFSIQTRPVPEPLTMLGAGAAIAFGAGFKRKLAQTRK